MIRLAVGLALLWGLFALALPQAQKKTGKGTPSLRQMQNRLESVRDRQAAVRRDLRQTRRKVNVLGSELRTVDTRLVELTDDLEETTQNLAAGRRQQQKLTETLQQTNVMLERTREQMRSRMRTMYKRGPGSTLSVLVGTESVGDLASRAYLAQRISHQDRELFDRFADLKDRVARAKSEKDAVVRRIGSLAATQRAQQDELEEIRQDKAASLSELKEKQEDLQRALQQFERDEAQIEATIQRFLAAQRRSSSGGGPRFTGGRFMRPVNAAITSGFGIRFHPILRRRRMHAGVDFGARPGTPIRAAGDGVVIATTYMGGYGNTVIIDHGGGISTLYAHTSRIFVQSGQRVRRGDRIAAVGSTGLSTGPHLHFEVRRNGRPVNPMGFL